MKLQAIVIGLLILFLVGGIVGSIAYNQSITKRYCTAHYTNQVDFDMCMISTHYIRVK